MRIRVFDTRRVFYMNTLRLMYVSMPLTNILQLIYVNMPLTNIWVHACVPNMRIPHSFDMYAASYSRVHAEHHLICLCIEFVCVCVDACHGFDMYVCIDVCVNSIDSVSFSLLCFCEHMFVRVCTYIFMN
jgi:hypothetical protein